jgi:hypothetical protein
MDVHLIEHSKKLVDAHTWNKRLVARWKEVGNPCCLMFVEEGCAITRLRCKAVAGKGNGKLHTCKYKSE